MIILLALIAFVSLEAFKFALLAIIVFVSSVALEFIVAKYFDSVRRHKAISASNYSVLWGAVGFIAGMSVYKLSLWMVTPELLGFWIGTYLAVTHNVKSNY